MALIFLGREIANAVKGDATTYLVTCHGFCRDVNVHLEVSSGDADLYAREEAPPAIENSNCEDCPLCKSRSSNLEDSCSGISTNAGASFYLTVTAHKNYRGASILISGNNLSDVEQYNES